MLDGLPAGITREDIDKMPPVRRQRLAQALRRAIDMLERPHAKPPRRPRTAAPSSLVSGMVQEAEAEAFLGGSKQGHTTGLWHGGGTTGPSIGGGGEYLSGHLPGLGHSWVLNQRSATRYGPRTGRVGTANLALAARDRGQHLLCLLSNGSGIWQYLQCATLPLMTRKSTSFGKAPSRGRDRPPRGRGVGWSMANSPKKVMQPEFEVPTYPS